MIRFRMMFAVIAMSLLFASGGRAQVPGVLLWPAGVPNAKGDTAADQPQLFIHKAPADKSVGAAVIVCPGGGYGGLMMSYEGHEVAQWFNEFGVTSFVLKYRLGNRYKHPAQIQDAQRAIQYVRTNAKQLGVAPDRIGIMGFSAGGHLSAMAATLFDREDLKPNLAGNDPLAAASNRPDFAVLCYPVITMTDPFGHRGSRRNLLGDKPSDELIDLVSAEKQVTAKSPSTFIFHTTNDRVVPVENALLMYSAFREAKADIEMHIYRDGPHGVGLFRKPSTAVWPEQLKSWMSHQGWLGESSKK